MDSRLTRGTAECLIFDWDGTLVDSQPANFSALSQAVATVGIRLDPEWFYSRTGYPAVEMLRVLLHDAGITDEGVLAELKDLRERTVLAQVGEIGLIKEVADVVTTYGGQVPMVIASGGTKRVIEATLQQLGIKSSFISVIAREDVDRGKPYPDAFLLAAQIADVSPERCLVYEDSDEGVSAATAANMRCIDVRPIIGRGK